jgi:hypothetical protein
MNWNANDPLEEYRSADFNKRLHLYLQYPELRSEFVEMDRNDLQREAPQCVPGFNCLPKIRLRSLFNLKAGCVRRRFSGST